MSRKKVCSKRNKKLGYAGGVWRLDRRKLMGYRVQMQAIQRELIGSAWAKSMVDSRNFKAPGT
jgi:hypothetical protein